MREPFVYLLIWRENTRTIETNIASDIENNKTMTTGILLYITLSLLAMLTIYGACLAAARADGAIDAQSGHAVRKAQASKVTVVEQPSQKMGDVV